jgi:hypothetical protein
VSADDHAPPPLLHRVAPATAPTVFSGRLEALAFPDLVEFLRSGRRSGHLALTSPHGRAALRLEAGRVVGASYPGAPPLGQVLVAMGKLAAPDLHAVAAKQARDAARPPLGALLVDAGLVDEATVRAALRRQVDDAVRGLLAWTEGDFAFTRAAPQASSGGVAFAVDAQEALLDAFRVEDEAARDRGGC